MAIQKKKEHRKTNKQMMCSVKRCKPVCKMGK